MPTSSWSQEITLVLARVLWTWQCQHWLWVTAQTWSCFQDLDMSVLSQYTVRAKLIVVGKIIVATSRSSLEIKIVEIEFPLYLIIVVSWYWFTQRKGCVLKDNFALQLVADMSTMLMVSAQTLRNSPASSSTADQSIILLHMTILTWMMIVVNWWWTKKYLHNPCTACNVQQHIKCWSEFCTNSGCGHTLCSSCFA